MCQTPSALVHIWEIIWPLIGKYPGFRTIATLSNSLVVTGKTANLFLFCMWSSHFRRNFQIIFSNYIPFFYNKKSLRKSTNIYAVQKKLNSRQKLYATYSLPIISEKGENEIFVT